MATSAVEPVNEVRLVGRVSGQPAARELPSGDQLVTFRVVVERVERSVTGRDARVDTIDVACWSARSRRSALRLAGGDAVEVHGSLRRRFWRTPGGPASRYEVEVARLVRRPRSSRAESRDQGQCVRD